MTAACSAPVTTSHHDPRSQAGRWPGARRLAASLALVLGLAATAPLPAWAREPAPPAADQLEPLNSRFRALYKERTQAVVEALPLVLVVQNSTITAVRGTHRRLYPVPLQRYNEARAVVHAALAFHGLMNQLAQADAAQAQWPRLEALIRDIRQAQLALPNTTLSRSEKAAAAKVLESLRAAAQTALTQRQLSRDGVAGTLRKIEPQLADIALSVGRAHAGNMLEVLDRVRADATAEEWQNAVAVVTGPMTPRRNNLETAVVAAALGAEHLGTRIFYTENIFSVDGALSYLQTVIGDQELSQNVFNDPQRMWEDLFAPVSRELVGKDFYSVLGGE